MLYGFKLNRQSRFQERYCSPEVGSKQGSGQRVTSCRNRQAVGFESLPSIKSFLKALWDGANELFDLVDKRFQGTKRELVEDFCVACSKRLSRHWFGKRARKSVMVVLSCTTLS